MKRLYALLVILIIAYIGINYGANQLDIFNKHLDDDIGNITVGDTSFKALNDFNFSKINDSAVSFANSEKKLTFNLSQIKNDTHYLPDLVAKRYDPRAGYTSNQTMNQSNVTMFFLNKEVIGCYTSECFFRFNHHNYMISGVNMPYNQSEYFTNTCKKVVDSFNNTNTPKEFKRW